MNQSGATAGARRGQGGVEPVDFDGAAADGFAPLVGLTIGSFMPVPAICAGGEIVKAPSTALRRADFGGIDRLSGRGIGFGDFHRYVRLGAGCRLWGSRRRLRLRWGVGRYPPVVGLDRGPDNETPRPSIQKNLLLGLGIGLRAIKSKPMARRAGEM